MAYIFLIKCFKNTYKIVDACNIIIKDFKDISFIGHNIPLMILTEYYSGTESLYDFLEQ